MTDENQDIDNALETMIDSTIDGIPAPIKKNLLKALNQLCGAAIDLGTAVIERKTDEIKAISEARKAIIRQASQRISESMDVPEEYVNAATEKYVKKIINQNKNLNDISKIAVEQIKLSGHSRYTTEDTEIEIDWLNEFDSQACKKSSAEMKMLFGKILAEEIMQPNSFSLKSIKILSEIDSNVAKLFKNFCSCSTTFTENNKTTMGMLINPFTDSVMHSALAQFGIRLYDLSTLTEYGLINHNFELKIDMTTFSGNPENLPENKFFYINEQHYLRTRPHSFIPATFVHGPMLSKVGCELYPIIDLIEDPSYTKALNEMYREVNQELAQLNS